MTRTQQNMKLKFPAAWRFENSYGWESNRVCKLEGNLEIRNQPFVALKDDLT